jgi:hypothetical protein
MKARKGCMEEEGHNIHGGGDGQGRYDQLSIARETPLISPTTGTSFLAEKNRPSFLQQHEEGAGRNRAPHR